jgi:hypothetical protein
MSTYTVKNATATGIVDPKFGTEYLVQFNEDARTVKMSRKDPVQVGQQENGEIKESKYGAYFKKESTWQPNQNSSGSASSVSATAPSNAKPAYRDNSDGMRQGMCINNAANWVNETTKGIDVSPREWAQLVHEHANELYRLGDLTAEAPVDESNQEIPATVAATFGITQ